MLLTDVKSVLFILFEPPTFLFPFIGANLLLIGGFYDPFLYFDSYISISSTLLTELDYESSLKLNAYEFCRLYSVGLIYFMCLSYWEIYLEVPTLPCFEVDIILYISADGFLSWLDFIFFTLTWEVLLKEGGKSPFLFIPSRMLFWWRMKLVCSRDYWCDLVFMINGLSILFFSSSSVSMCLEFLSFSPQKSITFGLF